jgi:plasmid stability protein
MKEKAHKRVQYTIRGVPAEVDRALRSKAAQRKQSVNQVVLDELTLATVGRPVRADFADLVGKWTPDPAFDEIVASQRQIDRDKWK